MNDDRPASNKTQSLLGSFRNAFQGIWILCRRERNFRLHLVFALAACLLAGGMQFSLQKWTILLLTIGLVMTAEALNSAIESLVDLIEPERHPLAGKAKDIAAGAVLIAALVSIMIGLLLFVPPVWTLISQYLE